MCKMQEVKNYITEEVEEEVYADVYTILVEKTYEKVKDGKIRDGYDGVVVSAAVSSGETVVLFLKKKGKDVYPDGLNCAGLSHVPQAAGTAGLVGVGNEVGLYVPLSEGDAWELGFKSTTGTPKVNWRLRIRLFRKG